MDFQALDVHVKRFEQMLKEVAQSNQIEGNLDKWKHDWPEATFDWSSADGISRSVSLYLDTDTQKTIVVEVNAWQDKNGQRKWQHEIMSPKYNINAWETAIRQGVQEAFTKVKNWTLANLTRD